MAIVIESSGECLRTKLLLLISEERAPSAEPVETQRRASGYFTELAHRIGPWVTVAGERHLEFNAGARALARSGGFWPQSPTQERLVEAWLEHQATWLRPAAVSIHHARQRGERAPDAEAILERSLRCLDARLQEHPTLAADYSPADAALWFLSALKAAGFDISEWRALDAAVERLEARPAVAQATRRFDALNAQPTLEGTP